MILVSSCSKTPPIIVPEFNTATEQYIFAKSLKDRLVMERPKGREKKTYEKALILAYKRVIDQFPEDTRVTPLAWVDLAETHYRLEEYEKAADLYEKAIQKYPQQDDILCKALFGAGLSHDKLKNFRLALSYYKQCYQRFENDPRSHIAIIGQHARINYSRIRVK